MISKLPRWVWFCAWVLAFIAGIINVVGLLGFEHQAVTHLTGNTSMLASALASLDVRGILHFAAVIGSFVAGTILSGFIIQDSTLQLGRRYGDRSDFGIRPALPRRAVAEPSQRLRTLRRRLRLRTSKRHGHAPIAARSCAPPTFPACSPTSAFSSGTPCAACPWIPSACACASWSFPDFSAAVLPARSAFAPSVFPPFLFLPA